MTQSKNEQYGGIIMSTGVCIINRNGIALAADSAGTFTGNKMFYNSMNKVFSLSRKNIYGVVTYGATVIHNVSIELILKEFRMFLDKGEALEDFFDILPSFTNFLKSKELYFKFNIDERESCISLINSLVSNWGNKLKGEIQNSNSQEKLEQILHEFENDINCSLKIEDYDVSEYIKAQYCGHYETILNIVVPEIKSFPEIKDRLWELICRYFNLSLKRETDSKMGLFFAGYGKQDAFPKFIHIELYTVINGIAKFRLIDKYEESNNNAQIIPLAQTDEILTFCKGISNYFINYIPQKVNELITNKINNLPKEFSEQQKNILKDSLGECKKEVQDSLNEAMQREYVNPILQSVQLIPLPEMAMLAENLVNITSLKRTFAIDGNQQTVGGPTDVAVMSKGDGFVWIKRKLYFDRKLNPDYPVKISKDY